MEFDHNCIKMSDQSDHDRYFQQQQLYLQVSADLSTPKIRPFSARRPTPLVLSHFCPSVCLSRAFYAQLRMVQDTNRRPPTKRRTHTHSVSVRCPASMQHLHQIPRSTPVDDVLHQSPTRSAIFAFSRQTSYSDDFRRIMRLMRPQNSGNHFRKTEKDMRSCSMRRGRQ